VALRRQSTATVWTPWRERRFKVLVDSWRDAAMRLPPVRGAGLSTGAARAATRSATRKWRRLSMKRTLSDIQRFFEPMNFSVQPIAFASQLIALPTKDVDLPFQIGALPIRFGPLATQPIDFGFLSLQLSDQIITRHGAPTRLHALVYATIQSEVQESAAALASLRGTFAGYDPLNRYKDVW
jgi:hypothetical protein